MSHTKDVHRSNYRFPIELIQKGQKGKNLLMLENGHATTPKNNDAEGTCQVNEINSDNGIRNIDDKIETEQNGSTYTGG